MNAVDDFIKMAEETLPPVCFVRDLIKLGIYRSEQSASYARKNKKSPPYMQLPTRIILYPKQGVLEYLRNAKNHKVWNEDNNSWETYTESSG